MPRAAPGCVLEVNPAGSALRFLTISEEPLTEVRLCGVKDENPANHPKTHWCAGYQPERTARGLEKPSLFEIVRVYLTHLERKGVLTDEMSHAIRIDLLYAVYAYLIWETNGLGGAEGGNKRCPKLMHKPDAKDWHAKVLEEGRWLGVPEKVYRSAGVLEALRTITTHKGALLQAHCCTAHCTGPAPPTAHAHSYLLRPPTIARQEVAAQYFTALRTAINEHRAAEKLQSVTATVGALVARQQQQEVEIEKIKRRLEGLETREDERDEQNERDEFEGSVQFDDSVQAPCRPCTGTAVAGSGSANQPAAATCPAAARGRRELPPRLDKVEVAQMEQVKAAKQATLEAAVSPASPASPVSSERSGDTEKLTPTIASPPQPEAGEMDQALAPVPPPVSAPAPAWAQPPAWALPPQMHLQGQPLSPVKASPNSPARPAAAGVSTSFCTPTQHVESPILVVPQPAKLASSGGEVRLGLLFTGAASEPLGSLSYTYGAALTLTVVPIANAASLLSQQPTPPRCLYGAALTLGVVLTANAGSLYLRHCARSCCSPHSERLVAVVPTANAASLYLRRSAQSRCAGLPVPAANAPFNTPELL